MSDEENAHVSRMAFEIVELRNTIADLTYEATRTTAETDDLINGYRAETHNCVLTISKLQSENAHLRATLTEVESSANLTKKFHKGKTVSEYHEGRAAEADDVLDILAGASQPKEDEGRA